RHTRWPRDWSSDVCSSDLARLLIIERVVVEENFFDLRKGLHCKAHFVGYIVGRAQAPAVTRVRLRPKTKRAHGRTASRRIKRNRSEERRVGKKCRYRMTSD